eukprot:COSAG02_NODE_4868_length_4881_cov_7.175659_3_plen_51_part_00
MTMIRIGAAPLPPRVDRISQISSTRSLLGLMTTNCWVPVAFLPTADTAYR